MEPITTAKLQVAPATAPGRDAPAPASGKALPDEGKNSPPAPEKVDLNAAIRQIESYLSNSSRSLSFTQDEASGRAVITVRNDETGEVIRQIPGDEVLRMAAAIQSGDPRLIDTQV